MVEDCKCYLCAKPPPTLSPQIFAKAIEPEPKPIHAQVATIWPRMGHKNKNKKKEKVCGKKLQHCKTGFHA